MARGPQAPKCRIAGLREKALKLSSKGERCLEPRSARSSPVVVPAGRALAGERKFSRASNLLQRGPTAREKQKGRGAFG